MKSILYKIGGLLKAAAHIFQKSFEQPFFNRLSTRLLFTLTLLSAVPLVLVIFFMRSVAIQSTRDIMKNKNILITRLAATEIYMTLNNPNIILDLLSETEDIRNMDPTTQNETIKRVITNHHPIFKKIYVINESGKVVSSSEKHLPSVKYTDRVFIENTIREKRRNITHAMFDKAHKPFLIFSYPIFETGQFLGVLAGEINIESIWKIVDDIKIGKTGNAFIISGSGQTIAHRDKSIVLKENNLIGIDIVNQVKTQSEISQIFKSSSGDLMLGTFVYLRDFDWIIATQQLANEYSAVPSALLYYKVLAFVILVIAIAILVALILERRITEPITSLISGVKRYAEGDLNYRINLNRFEEIAVLAKEFNSMASSLDENQKKLRRVERLAAMSKFATLVSHEIRNPLNSMNINMKILKREMENPGGDIEKKQKYFNIISSEINRMDNLIKNFLMIARPPRFDYVLNDMHGILEEVILLHRENSKLQNVSIIKDFQDAKMIANVDRDQMKQVFHNITINALQAMPGGGELKIQTHLKKMDTNLDQNVQFIRIKFIDTGVGIPEDKIRNIFEVYYTMKKTGTGLGLAIARQIVEGHFGSIDVKSTIGEGTTVIVSLPTNYEFETL